MRPLVHPHVPEPIPVNTSDTPARPGGEGTVGEVSPRAAQRLLARGEAVLVDVREIDEWEAGHARGASHRPLSRLTSEQIETGRLVIVVCRSGRRSLRAAELLRHGGHQVCNLAGGMQSWLAAGLSVHRDDGSRGEIR